MLTGIFVSILFWARLARRDDRLVLIYVAALVGAFLGAKLVYIIGGGMAAFRDVRHVACNWPRANPSSVLPAGRLLCMWWKSPKRARQAIANVTGDWFALIAPVGIIIGRIGCLMHGCCLGTRLYTGIKVHVERRFRNGPLAGGAAGNSRSTPRRIVAFFTPAPESAAGGPAFSFVLDGVWAISFRA